MCETESRVNDAERDCQSEDRMRRCLQEGRCMIVVAGAGISTASGVDDYKSPGGLIKRLGGRSILSATIYGGGSVPADVAKYHTYVQQASKQAFQASPSKFHKRLDDLARAGRLLRLYTQNVDCLDTDQPFLQTQVPLPSNPPWPRTVQLHGSLRYMQCSACSVVSEIALHRFNGPRPPRCEQCILHSQARVAKGRRRTTPGFLRPRMLLYDEPSADGWEGVTIQEIIDCDVNAGADALIVAGTAMTVPGVRQLVRELVAGVRAHPNGVCIWVNVDPPRRTDLDLFDFVVQETCDQFAQWIPVDGAT